MARTLTTLLAAAFAASISLGCPAVYPELATGLHKVAGDRKLDPPPPEELRWIRILSAKIPGRARDGRTWDQAFGSLPDPYARLYVNDKELLRTPAQADTIEPTWPDAPRGNFPMSPDDKLRVEVWDSNPLNDRPIGVRDIGRVSGDQRASGLIRVELEGGAEVQIAFEPARAMLGLGLWYELRTDSVYITRLLAQSPAARAGVQPGDQVLEISGREVSGMSEGEVRSAFNAVPAGGMPLVLVHPDGATLNVTLKEGPIYPTYAQFGRVD